MSEIAQSAHVNITVADYIAPGQAGKLTIVGSGISIAGCDPKSGRTAPLSAVATVTFDARFVGESPIVEFTLEADDGTLVELPPPPDAADEGPQPLRITADGPLNPTIIEGVDIPASAARPKVQMMVQVQNGLPLKPARLYYWRVTVDGESRDEWTEPLYVPAFFTPPKSQN